MATISASAPVVFPQSTPAWKETQLKNVEKNKIYTYIQDVKTGDLYWSDERVVVFIKCMAIGLIGNIAATVLRSMYYLTKPCWKVPQNIFKAFANIARTFRKHPCKATFDFAFRVAIQIPCSLVKCIIGIARSIFFGALIQGSTLIAFCSPYEARKQIAKFELMLNKGKKYNVSLHNQCAHVDPMKAPLPQTYKIIKNTQSFYLAWCFQSRGNIADKLPNGKAKFIPAM